MPFTNFHKNHDNNHVLLSKKDELLHRDDVLLHKYDVMEILGDVSHMYLKELCKDPTSNFPKPRYKGRRPIWWRSEIVAWFNQLPRWPAPQAKNTGVKNP